MFVCLHLYVLYVQIHVFGKPFSHSKHFYGENHARVGGAHGATEIFGSIMSEPLTDYVDSNLASWPVLKTPCSPILSPVVLHTDTQHYVENLRLGKL